jgi:hypothetical protein
MDFIRVSDDKWNFEEKTTGKRFIPFGTNFVFNYLPEETPDKAVVSLSILTDEIWRPDIIAKAIHTARQLNMNIIKVFLPLPGFITDPQSSDTAVIKPLIPTLFERLDFLFDTAEKNEIYISLTTAEWGVQLLKWFHDGGAFFGSKGSGLDSFKIMQSFWKQIAELCKSRVSLFSYNLAVELYIPGGNWGGAEKVEPDQAILFEDRWGKDAFADFLKTKYVTINALNNRWNSSYTSFEDIEQPYIKWLKYKNTYTVNRQIVSDYNDFKEIVIYLFLKNQCDAIRSIDSNHMITAGLHPDQTAIGPKGDGWKTAGPNNKEYDIFDYITVHLYTHISYLISRPYLSPDYNELVRPFQADNDTLAKRRKECILYARFVDCGKPVLLEEFGNCATDCEESLVETIKLAEELIGHVSGLMLWYLGGEGDFETSYAPMSVNFKLSRWGNVWKKFFEPGGAVYDLPIERTPARTIVKLDRFFGNAPDSETASEKIVNNWDAYMHPVDFEWPLNESLLKMKQQNKTKIWI